MILIGSAVFWLFSSLFVHRLPTKDHILPAVYEQPIQTETQREPFMRDYQGVKYLLKPRFAYEIKGLVVSSRDLAKTWFNIYYDRDPLNIKDACIIWGGNLAKDDFQDVTYKSRLWTCEVRCRDCRSALPINMEELSNNHLLPMTEEVAKKIRQVRTGDQVFIKGLLVDYTKLGNGSGGERKTSIFRSDQGQGACEVVAVEELKILKPANVAWRFIQRVGFLMLLGSVVVKGVLFVWSLSV
jgi:hypothetical protein